MKNYLPNRKKNKIKRSVKVLVVNCRSIVDKKKEYENLIHSTKPDIGSDKMVVVSSLLSEMTL